MATIYDAKTSFNKYILSNFDLYDSNINCFFQPNQDICYPALISRSLITASLDEKLYEFSDVIEINIIYNDGNDMSAIMACQQLYNIFDFKSSNVMSFFQIPLYDYTTNRGIRGNRIGCLRVSIERSNGWRYIKSPDPNVRHYQIDLVTNYKI